MSELQNCPFCGARITDPSFEICPYCGCVLSDKSDERTAKAIADTTAEKKRLIEQPKKLALIIAGAMTVTIAVAIILIFTFFTDSASYHRSLDKVDKKTAQMEEAYEAKDWDALYDMVILNCDDYIGSEYYYTYRTAWYLHTFPQEFDAAYAQKDLEQMEKIYDYILEDDNLRQTEYFMNFCHYDEEIDAALHEECLRQQQLIESLKK